MPMTAERPTIPDGLRAQPRAALDPAPPTRKDARPTVDARWVPWRVMSLDQVPTLHMDHRAGFVLSLVDGQSSVETILDVCGIDEEEASEILIDLADLGAIDFRVPHWPIRNLPTGRPRPPRPV